MKAIAVIRGAGDLASGVAIRLARCGVPVCMLELPEPLVVRRLASFAEAIFCGEFGVEQVGAQRANSLAEVRSIALGGRIPLLVDPDGELIMQLGKVFPEVDYSVLVDARMLKRPPGIGKEAANLVIGLGPGFTAGVDCHAVVETRRGHFLGRVIWQGSAQADTGLPDTVEGIGSRRVLRAPADGVLLAQREIGDRLEKGDLVATVAGQEVRAPFKGVLRGLLHPGLAVQRGLKIGDVDPRDDPRYCTLVSDKALAIGGGVLEAVFSRPAFRARFEG